MPAYRFYSLDGVGKFSAARWIDAEDDVSAIASADIVNPGAPFEIWCGNRLIHRSPAGEPPAGKESGPD